MTGIEVHNWGKDVYSFPATVVAPESLEELIAIMKDKEKYPAPVRAVGSNHSTTRCGVADGGTMVVMKQFNKILEVAENTVTAQAGALYIDVNEQLEKQGKQLFVNVELGNLTMGSASSGGTKDASMPGEMGQVCSYAIVIKMVGASGETLEFNENDPALLQMARSSYGLIGIVYECTFRIQRLRPMSVYHESYGVEEFVHRLPELKARNHSMMFYLFPHDDKVTVEFRHYHDGDRFSRRWIWAVRNWAWKSFAPFYGRVVSKYVVWLGLRYWLVDRLSWVTRVVLTLIVRGPDTSPSAQMIRYPEVSGLSKYTFSIWAFSEDVYPEALPGYFQFCKDYYRKYKFRCDLPNVGYRIAKDQGSLFSYSFNGTVMTLDPVATGALGWDEFLRAYNEFCSGRGGVPLFNQTKWITPAQARKAFGERIAKFRGFLEKYDPKRRMLNDYFRGQFYD
jgi:FAD binding domain